MDNKTHKDIMLKVARNLTEQNIDDIKYYYSEIGVGILEKIKTAIKLIEALEHHGFLEVGNYVDFVKVLQKIGRSDLVKDCFNESIPVSRVNIFNMNISDSSNMNGFELNLKHFDKIAYYVGTDYSRFGIHLGLTNTEIDIIDADYRTTLEKAKRVLVKWSQKNKNVTWQEIKQNLELIDRFDIIRHIEKDFPDIITPPVFIGGKKGQPELTNDIDVEKMASKELSQSGQMYQPQVSYNPILQMIPTSSLPSLEEIQHAQHEKEKDQFQRDQPAQQESIQSQHEQIYQVKPLVEIQADGAQKVLQQEQQQQQINKINEQNIINNKDEKYRQQQDDLSSQVDINLLNLEDKLNMDQFVVEKKIAITAYGKVCLCTNKNTNTKVAMKCITTGKIEGVSRQMKELKREVESFEEEIKIFKNLDHIRIVKYYGTIRSETQIFIVMEYMEGGSLYHKINKGALDEKTASIKSYQILEGLAYLHSKGIIHRDVKSENVLLDLNGNCKLADFGVSKQQKTLRSRAGCRTLTGTIPYMAPEVFESSTNGNYEYGNKADIWSFGCTVMEMLISEPPNFHLTTNSAIAFHRTQPTIPELPESVSKSCKSFVNACLQRDPEIRPNATTLMLHDWIKLSRE